MKKISPPFDELIFSWNAARPMTGKYLFYVRARIDEWSPWLLYASWGSSGQSSFLSTAPEASARVYQDALEVLEGKKATGFQIKIVAEGGAVLDDIHSLHVYVNSDQTPVPTASCLQPIRLPIEGLSQMALPHVRSRSLCSPTSTTAAVRYLSKTNAIDPIYFAEGVWDGGFDIFGNWVLNVAQAASLLGPAWQCWVERLDGFAAIYKHLQQGVPVIVSVRGPLLGSAEAYAQGHLLVVTGYEPSEKKVLCMDPAFPLDSKTHVGYDLADFVQAWNRRGRVAYVFARNDRLSLCDFSRSI